MSEEQHPGSSETPANNQHQPSRTVRRRRPTNLPPDETRRNEVRILRPSEVPRRDPLPDYTEPEARRIIPSDVPLDRLHELHNDPCRDVVVPPFATSGELLQEAARTSDLVSFRSANYVEPSEGGDCPKSGDDEESVLSEDIKAFIRRNSPFLGEKIYGCTAYKREADESVWDVVVEAPSDSLYDGGIFFVEVQFNKENAYFVPSVRFKTLMFHPSLSGNGYYDMRGLVKDWGRFATIDVLFKYLTNEMRNLKEHIQKKTLAEIEDYAQPNISRMALENWEKFEEIAQLFTQRMAGIPLSADCEDFSEPADMGTVYTERYGWRRPNTPDIDIVGL